MSQAVVGSFRRGPGVWRYATAFVGLLIVFLSAPAALETMQTIRHVTFKLNGKPRCGVSAASPRAHPVLAALGLRELRPPAPPATEETVM